MGYIVLASVLAASLLFVAFWAWLVDREARKRAIEEMLWEQEMYRDAQRQYVEAHLRERRGGKPPRSDEAQD